MDHEDSRGASAVKFGLIGAAVIGAGYFAFMRGSAEDRQLDTPESASPYICLDDGHTFKLTPARLDELLKSGGAKSAGGEDGRGGALMIRCPKCGKFTSVLAQACPKDQTVFALTAKDGQPGRCPKCGRQPGADQ